MPEGVTSLLVEMVGAGGGGGCSVSGGGGGGGGGAGAYARFVYSVEPGDTLRFEIGGRGVGCDRNAETPATDGGATELVDGGMSVAVAEGGSAGGNASGDTGGTHGSGGWGTVPSTGFLLSGGFGGQGVSVHPCDESLCATGPKGPGGQAKFTAFVGGAGTPYGSGGAGGGNHWAVPGGTQPYSDDRAFGGKEGFALITW